MTILRRRGTTLIELLFGLIILSTLLAAIVTARGRFLRSAADAKRKEKLAAALDLQLEQWFAGAAPGLPQNSSGPLTALSGARWTTRKLVSTPAADLGCQSVQVEATDDRSPPARVVVGIVVHEPEPTVK